MLMLIVAASGDISGSSPPMLYRNKRLNIYADQTK